MNTKTFLVLLITLFAFPMFASGVLAAPGHTDNFHAQTGHDTTGDGDYYLTPEDLDDVADNDEDDYTTNLKWTNEEYTDEDVLDFYDFDIDLPENLLSIDEVTLYFDWAKRWDIAGARIRVWDESEETWHTYNLNLPGENHEDQLEEIDLSSYIDNVNDLENLIVRYQAHDGSDGGLRTEHDWAEIEVEYTLDEEGPEISDMTNNPEYPTCDYETVKVCADVEDDSEIESVYLECTSSSGGSSGGVMSLTEGNTYCRDVSRGSLSCGDNVDVSCTVTATDEWDNEGSLTEDPLFTYDNLPPTADAGGPYTCDEGDTKQLDGSGSSDTVDDELDFAWDYDNDNEYDDATGEYSNPKFTCVDDGEYLVSLKVTDDAGHKNTDDSTVTVNNLPPTADAGGPYTCDEGDTISLNASRSSDPGVEDELTYTWDFNGDGEYDDAEGMYPEYTCGNGDDEADVYLKVTDDDGGEGFGSASVLINNLPPEVTIDNVIPQPVEEGSEVTVYVSFTDYFEDTHTAEVDWGTGDEPEYLGDVESPFEASHTYCNEGEYYTIVYVEDDEGAQGSGGYEIEVINVAPSNLNIEGPDKAEKGETVEFTGSAEDPGCDELTYIWDFDYDGETFGNDAYGETVEHTYTERGTYTVALKVDDGTDYTIVTHEIEIFDYKIFLTDEEWNLVSLPLVPLDGNTEIENVFDDVLGNVKTIWSYQMGKWKVYSQAPNDLVNIVPGYGYYIGMSESDTTYQNGKKMYGDDTPPQPPVVTVTPSWNLIGHYGMLNITKEDALETIKDNYATVIDKDGNPVSVFNPTEGYWLFLTGLNNLYYAPSEKAYNY